MNIGVVLAGGSATRFGGNKPKQYQLINNKEVIAYSIEALKKSDNINEIIVVASESENGRLQETYGIKVVPNGNTRNESLYNALHFIHKHHACDKIIIVEAARPMLTAKIVTEYLELLDSYDSVITGQKIVDSLGCFSKNNVNRDDYYLIQAPEAFNFQLLYEKFDKNSILTATNQQMPEESKLFVNFDFKNNYKITYAQDLSYCENILKENE